MTSWTWAAASCRGTSHVRNSTRRQDAFSCSVAGIDGNTIIAVVSDGAGSASMGGEGASLACRTILWHAKKYFAAIHESSTSSDADLKFELDPPSNADTIDFAPETDFSDHASHSSDRVNGTEDWNGTDTFHGANGSKLPSDELLRQWIMDARHRICLAAESRSIRHRDFAATLVLAISSGAETLVAHIGDGSIVFLSEETSEWHVASWPSHGEYASTTFFLTDDPEPQIKFARITDSISALALFSDGIENLALELDEQKAHQRFFESIIRPLKASSASGRDVNLSGGLARFLDSAKVNDRTDDDKTLILAVRR